MTRNPIVDLYPLTDGQEERLARVVAGTDAGLAHLELEVAGAESTEALAGALEGLAGRHPALRTTFAWERTPTPVQVVRAQGVLPVEQADLSAAAPAEIAGRVAAFVADASVADPTNPQTRVALFRTGGATHRLVWSWHPLVLDARSALVLTRDALFGCAGVPLRAPGVFRECMAWREAREPSAAAALWRARRAEAEAEAPADPAVRDELCLSPAAAAALQAMARRYTLSHGTLVRGAWALTVAANPPVEEEVAFGVCVAGVPPGVERAEEIVGPLAGVAPVRARVAPDEAAWRWLERLQGAGDPLPGYLPWRAGAGTRQASAVAVQVAPPHVSGFAVRVLDAGGPRAAPLMATVFPDEGWRLRVEGPAGEAAAALARFGSLLESIARYPERRLCQVAAPAAESAEPPPGPPLGPAAPDRGDDGAPLTPTERAIAGAWAEVLGLPGVRRGDNFFELGGDSLLLIRVLWRLQERVGPHVQIADLFQHRTLSALARRLDAPPGDADRQAVAERANTRRILTMRAGAARDAALPPEGAGDE